MKKFSILISQVVPLNRENIDTDQIIPARFLKETGIKIFGQHLFRDWRYNKNDNLNTNFVLNNPYFSGQILLSGRNFGCGSSREHAVWAIMQYGFKVVISSFFADIFKENAFNNGLLTLEVSNTFLNKLFYQVEQNYKTKILINLIKQKIMILETSEYQNFTINSYQKNCFLNGYDNLSYLRSITENIEMFEKKTSYFHII
ncbi:3-isopropylmalate dehydratase small subunit [Blattabacterium cuenoti]|uniref:3-isopropylmalate dehydratase small subunit n=1 Tax=Blattabacterium cuenoti TaxID=1653831 RepID=UPI00163D16A4|nr:3-isopropylmalate dehydratase small subunit [Blattabacterium cuenoti]